VSKLRVRLNRRELTALVAGFVLMVFELAGARVLAPYIGSSTYVWTSVIGVIIAALSLGYWAGGKIADSRGYAVDIGRLALLAAILITLTTLQYQGILQWVAQTFEDPRLQGVAASFILFAPTSFVLGSISPYLAKLNVRSLKATGRSVASLSALNSIGGILGTFIAGFILFGFIGSKETLALMAVAMVGASWLLVPGADFKLRIFVSAAIIATVLIPVPAGKALSIDTPSANYSVYDVNSVRYLATGPYAAQSGVNLNEPDKLAFWYTQQFADVVAHVAKKQRILILGGGAFTLPEYFALKYPDTTIDVVEIDPVLADIARQHFGYTDPSNVNLIYQDARTYVNQTLERYDVVIADVYGDSYIPYTFLTREYGDAVSRLVTPGGVLTANFIAGATNSACQELFRALDAPYRAHFAYNAYSINTPKAKFSNIIVAYSNQPVGWPGAKAVDIPQGSAYSDNFVPAERLEQGCRLR
jgi:MFS family permease